MQLKWLHHNPSYKDANTAQRVVQMYNQEEAIIWQDI